MKWVKALIRKCIIDRISEYLLQKTTKYQNKEIMKQVNEFAPIVGTTSFRKKKGGGSWRTGELLKFPPKKDIQIFFTKRGELVKYGGCFRKG